MTPDLFSAAESGRAWSNYATRLAYLWIAADPALDDRCQQTAKRHARKRARTRQRDLPLAEELRIIVTAEALLIERSGLFADLFADRPPEIRWSELAAFYMGQDDESP